MFRYSVAISIIAIFGINIVTIANENLSEKFDQKIKKELNLNKEQLVKKFSKMQKIHFEDDVANVEKRANLRSKMSNLNREVHVLSERMADRFEKKFAKKFEAVLFSRNTKELSSLWKKEKGKFTLWPSVKLKSTQIVNLERGQINGSSKFNKTKKKSKMIESIKSFINDFSKVEFSEVKLSKMIWNDRKMNSGYVVMEFDVRGYKGKRRMQARGEFTLPIMTSNEEIVPTGLTLKYIDKLKLNRNPAYSLTKNNLGFDKGKVYPRLEALRRGGYAFAVEDFDGDGNLDAFIGNHGSSTLWKGNSKGEFVEVASKVNELTLAKAAAFADLDNDGDKDLVVSRFSNERMIGDVWVYKNNNGELSPVKEAFPSKIIRDYAMPLALGDFNNDGLIDVYIGFPGERDFSLATSEERSSNESLIAHGLFLNKGDLKFKDNTTKALDKKILSKSSYPHGAIASDYDRDGNIDILVMDDRKNLSPIFKNNGDGTFKFVSNDIGIQNEGYGMGIDVGDINNDGHLDVVMSNATFRTESRNYFPKPFRIKTNTVAGLRLFINNGNGTYREETSRALLGNTGEGAAGVTLVDYDNDGHLDIYLTNGLWSGSSKWDNVDSLFAQGQILTITTIDHMQTGLGLRKSRETQSPYMKMLLGDRTRSGKTLSFAGFQRNRLFKNLGNGEFLELGYLEGADSQSDGYMSLVADYNKDGRADLMLRNCDPGASDNQFPVVEVLKNQFEDRNNSIWLTLKGSKSNSHGIGANVISTIGGREVLRIVKASNSAIQSPMQVHIGLDKNKSADLLIEWPSGKKSKFKNVGPGHHEIHEKSPSIYSVGKISSK